MYIEQLDRVKLKALHDDLQAYLPMRQLSGLSVYSMARKQIQIGDLAAATDIVASLAERIAQLQDMVFYSKTVVAAVYDHLRPKHRTDASPQLVIEFALTIDDTANMREFLNAWTHGEELVKWPEFATFNSGDKGGEDE